MSVTELRGREGETHVVLRRLCLKLFAKYIIDSRPHPPPLCVGGECEVIWLHMTESYKETILTSDRAIPMPYHP